MMELAHAGDHDAFAELIAPYRGELHLHCYRMLGSITDADDLLQETMIAAWRGMGGFAGRSSLRAWLYRIATNRCLNAIRDSKRRPPPVPVPSFEPPPPSRREDVTWLQPYPDAWIDSATALASEPSSRFQTHDSVRLAFITALQRLPPRQTAVLILRDVLDFPAAEVATMLGSSPTAVKGLLQRARASLQRQHPDIANPAPGPDSAANSLLAQRFADAYSSDDIDALLALLTNDAWLAMPPAPHEYHGSKAIAAFLRAGAAARAGWQFALRPTRANAQPAFSCYLRPPDGAAAQPTGIVVLTCTPDRIAGVTHFLDFDLPTIFETRGPAQIS